VSHLSALAVTPPLSYLTAFIAALDAIVPVLPGGTAVITLGATAGSTDPRTALPVAPAAAGAFARDNLNGLPGTLRTAAPWPRPSPE
jgi:hypothetical protein